MRYGTVPMVRRTGGLKDTVIDFGDTSGYGICYDYAAVGDICHGVWRAVELYHDKEKDERDPEADDELDFSWETSVKQYIKVYEDVLSIDDV